MSEDSQKKLDEIFIKVASMEQDIKRFTDVQLSRADLAKKWNVNDETIRNYNKRHGMPRLRNGKYHWRQCVDWLYTSPIGNTLEGLKIKKVIESKSK